MQSALPPPKPAPRPAPAPSAVSRPASASGPIQFGTVQETGDRIGVYGPGGIGKTSLALLAPGPVAFFDLDKSLSKLRRGGTSLENVRTVDVSDWASLRAALAAPGWDSIRTIVIDSGTKAEEMATRWITDNIALPGGGNATSLESYSFGRGAGYLYDQMNLLICTDLESHALAGRHVVVICHESKGSVPNVLGEDYLRAEPFLPNAKARNFRERFRDWCDQLWYVSYDIAVKDDKVKASGSRAIKVVGHPAYFAKSRTLKQPEYVCKPGDGSIWTEALGL